MWWMVAAAFGADLEGWDGIPWGSTKGGPKDPAMASSPAVVAKRLAEGELGLARFQGDIAGVPAVFAGVPVRGLHVVYVDGAAAAFVAMLAPGGALNASKAEIDAAAADLTSALGAPSETGAAMWHFETAAASVTLQMNVITVRSKAQMARCAELFGLSCELLRSVERAAMMAP